MIYYYSCQKLEQINLQNSISLNFVKGKLQNLSLHVDWTWDNSGLKAKGFDLYCEIFFRYFNAVIGKIIVSEARKKVIKLQFWDSLWFDKKEDYWGEKK